MAENMYGKEQKTLTLNGKKEHDRIFGKTNIFRNLKDNGKTKIKKADFK